MHALYLLIGRPLHSLCIFTRTDVGKPLFNVYANGGAEICCHMYIQDGQLTRNARSYLRLLEVVISDSPHMASVSIDARGPGTLCVEHRAHEQFFADRLKSNQHPSAAIRLLAHSIATRLPKQNHKILAQALPVPVVSSNFQIRSLKLLPAKTLNPKP